MAIVSVGDSLPENHNVDRALASLEKVDLSVACCPWISQSFTVVLTRKGSKININCADELGNGIGLLYLAGAVLLVEFVLVCFDHVDEVCDRLFLDDRHVLKMML